MRLSFSDRLFYFLNALLLFIFALIVLLPLMHVASVSVSSPTAVATGKVRMLPVDLTFFAYERILRGKVMLRGFANSLFYTCVGTTMNIVLTVMAAYPLSRKRFFGRNVITTYFVFTMLFSGGLIPTYLLVRALRLLDTRWAMILPNPVSVYLIIIARTFFQHTIPEELYDVAETEGATDGWIVRKVVIPISRSVIAVLCLFYAMGHWNAYFNALIYLRSTELFPLQLVLRMLQERPEMTGPVLMTIDEQVHAQERAEVLKYATIIFASFPMLLLYPFIQRYFTKGIMIGALKA